MLLGLPLEAACYVVAHVLLGHVPPRLVHHLGVGRLHEQRKLVDVLVVVVGGEHRVELAPQEARVLLPLGHGLRRGGRRRLQERDQGLAIGEDAEPLFS